MEIVVSGFILNSWKREQWFVPFNTASLAPEREREERQRKTDRQEDRQKDSETDRILRLFQFAMTDRNP